jgi:transposase
MENENSQNKLGLQVEVPMILSEVVQSIRTLSALGWGSRRIAKELGVARETARRYAQKPAVAAGLQLRPQGRRLQEAELARVHALWTKEAAGNAVVVQRLMAEEGVNLSLRTVQRVTAPARAHRNKQDKATVRFETPPGSQMQIDFGQKLIMIAGVRRKIYLFVAVLGFSRRLFVLPTLSERQEDWQEGVAKAFLHFGGSTKTLLIDNPKAMVLSNTHDGESRKVVLHPTFAAFCKDWDVEAKACTPSRARTKGKVENGVGYVKHNAIADLSFTSFEALCIHIERWMHHADRRVHGTTKMKPIDMFESEEKGALMPLPVRPVAARTRRLKRKVANDCFVDIDTVRYSVPHRFVGAHVMVEVGEHEVRIYEGDTQVATHTRCQEPHQRIVIQGHFAGLLRAIDTHKEGHNSLEAPKVGVSDMASMGRTLDVYAQVVEGAAS